MQSVLQATLPLPQSSNVARLSRDFCIRVDLEKTYCTRRFIRMTEFRHRQAAGPRAEPVASRDHWHGTQRPAAGTGAWGENGPARAQGGRASRSSGVPGAEDTPSQALAARGGYPYLGWKACKRFPGGQWTGGKGDLVCAPTLPRPPGPAKPTGSLHGAGCVCQPQKVSLGRECMWPGGTSQGSQHPDRQRTTASMSHMHPT